MQLYIAAWRLLLQLVQNLVFEPLSFNLFFLKNGEIDIRLFMTINEIRNYFLEVFHLKWQMLRNLLTIVSRIGNILS